MFVMKEGVLYTFHSPLDAGGMACHAGQLGQPGDARSKVSPQGGRKKGNGLREDLWGFSQEGTCKPEQGWRVNLWPNSLNSFGGL